MCKGIRANVTKSLTSPPGCDVIYGRPLTLYPERKSLVVDRNEEENEEDNIATLD